MNQQPDDEDAQIDTVPPPRETTSTIVPVSAKTQPEEPESTVALLPAKELVQLDEIESIQSWAMQSQPWKFLNVLIDSLTAEQLQRVASDDN